MGITLTEFSEKNAVLESERLQSEKGYARLPNGNYLVSMTCPMPGVTTDMVQWWFWWHPQADERYRAWFPGEHFRISYAGKDKAYFAQKTVPAFRPNTQYPVERIGGRRLPLRIDFVTPEAFGFEKRKMDDNGFPLIVCGHVGAIHGLIWHTEMAHMFRQEADGLFLISRFWIGQLAGGRLLRKAILTEETAKGMAEHCCQEYRNLAAMLPGLYARERD